MGETNFTAGLQTAKPLLAMLPDHTPLLVFMTDGMDGGKISAVQTTSNIAQKFSHQQLQVYTVGFDAGASTDVLLLQMAQTTGEKFFTASSVQKLDKYFVDIATSCSAVDTLAKRFGEMVSEMVANKLILDFL